jgi:uncharacterized glyoxalase superfamily protein PhnB
MDDGAFPMFTVGNLVAATRFYEQLGFAVNYEFPPDGEPVFVTMERGAATIGFGAGAAEEERYGLWVYVDDVDATCARLRAAGAEMVAEPEDQPWGERVARMRDPEGNLVYLGASTRAGNEAED